MHNLLSLALLVIVCLLVPGYPNAKDLSREPDNGFTEDTLRPYDRMPESGAPIPSEPPLFQGATKHEIAHAKNDIYIARMYYPSFGKPDLDKTIKDWATEYCEEFAHDAFKEYERDRESFIKWELAGTYSIAQASQNAISVLFRIFLYGGGAHGSNHYIAKTFDTRTGREIPKAAFFTDQKSALSVLSAFCRTDIAQREDSEGLDSLDSGTEATPENFSTIVPRKNGLLVVFYSGQLGCMASGSRVVFVPLEKLRDHIEPGKIWE